MHRKPDSPARRHFLAVTGAALLSVSMPEVARAAAAGGSKLKIGIVGSGRVGSAIGASWARAGHTVMFASLDIEHDRKLAAGIGANAKAGTPREAAAFGDVLMISVPYHALPAVGKDLGELLKNKIVIDTCNPFEQRDGEIGIAARKKGAGLASLDYLPGARIVRAFNAIGAARMGAAWQNPGAVGMPISGEDKQAIEVASRLIRDVGYEPVLIGGYAMGRHLQPREPLAGERTPEEIRKIAATLK